MVPSMYCLLNHPFPVISICAQAGSCNTSAHTAGILCVCGHAGRCNALPVRSVPASGIAQADAGSNWHFSSMLPAEILAEEILPAPDEPQTWMTGPKPPGSSITEGSLPAELADAADNGAQRIDGISEVRERPALKRRMEFRVRTALPCSADRRKLIIQTAYQEITRACRFTRSKRCPALSGWLPFSMLRTHRSASPETTAWMRYSRPCRHFRQITPSRSFPPDIFLESQYMSREPRSRAQT